MPTGREVITTTYRVERGAGGGLDYYTDAPVSRVLKERKTPESPLKRLAEKEACL